MDCTVHHPENAGYLCSNATSSCKTLAYFRVQPGSFTTLPSIANTLFNTSSSSISASSSLPSSTTQLSVGQGLFIPLNCQCYGNHSSHNITYTIVPSNIFVTLANRTYEGLTTCQAIQDANPAAVPTNLQIGQQVVFPLRCACPSQEQSRRGIQMLLTYPVDTGDTVSTILNMFGNVTQQEFLSANDLTSPEASLYPGTTVLVPYLFTPTVPPNSSIVTTSSPPPIASPSKSSKTGIYIGVPIAAAVFLVLIVVACLITKKRKASKDNMLIPIPSSPPKVVKPPKSSKLQQDLFAGMSLFAGSEILTTYTLEELKQATHDFSPSTHIRGAVYRGVIKGQVVAVKNMTRNVTKELQILQKVHHANLVTLLGACVSSPEESYLVYEYAENGSLSDLLHDTDSGMSSESSSTLTWNNRLQVALDVATALEYLHDHTNPSFVHKDIKSSNILLDSKFRGKVANFGLAKSTEEMEQGSALTRHIVGTQGYLAPEYLAHGRVSPKMDVFAFGVVLLEILSGEEAMSNYKGGEVAPGKEPFLSQAIKSVLEGSDAKEKLKGWMDRRLQNAYPLDCAYSVALLARSCVADDPDARPSTREVAYTLAKALETSLEWEPSSTIEENYTDHHLEAR